MSIDRTLYRKLAAALILALAGIGMSAALMPSAEAIIVNFDALNTSGGSASGIQVVNYLAINGITWSASSNVTPVVERASPWAVAPSSPNVFTVSGSTESLSWTFRFASPEHVVSFIIPKLLSGVRMAAWTATAYSGTTVSGQVGEPSQASGSGTIAQRTFTLNGSGITRVLFNIPDADDAFTRNLVLDNLTTTMPIPGAVWLFGSGLLGLIAIARHRKSI